MRFRINYWRKQSGKAPVEQYIDSIVNLEERAELLSLLQGVQEFGDDAVSNFGKSKGNYGS